MTTQLIKSQVDHMAIALPSGWTACSIIVFQVDHLAEVKELAEDGDWAIRIPTTVVIELEVIIDDHYGDCESIYEILHDDYYGDFRVLR